MDTFRNLNCLNPDVIINQVPNFYAKGYGIFPNFPIVYLSVKPWIIQESKTWIITKDLPKSIFTCLFKRNLVPHNGYNYTYPNMERQYYKEHSYNYCHA